MSCARAWCDQSVKEASLLEECLFYSTIKLEEEGGDLNPQWFGSVFSILISTAIASSLITLVDLSKENVVVVDSAKQTEISVFLKNSWDGDLMIAKCNLQGSSSPP